MLTNGVGKSGWGIIVKFYQSLTFQLKNDYICILILKKHQKLILDKMAESIVNIGFDGIFFKKQFVLYYTLV
jgi:hypothetical protein